MKKNDFHVDTASPVNRRFIQKKQTLLGLALLLTVPQMFSAVIFPVLWVLDAQNGKTVNLTSAAANELYFLVMSVAGVAVLKMMFSEKPFSKTLIQCTRLEGGLIAAASAIFPLLPGYRGSGLTFLFFDGILLLPGLLLIIMAELLKEAFAMQEELNEIL